MELQIITTFGANKCDRTDRRFLSLLALAIAFFALLGLMRPGYAGDSVLDRAQSLINEGKAGQAYELLLPLESQRSGEPDYDYMLGIAALDSGRPTEAVFALERVLAVDPDHVQARAEIARAYFELREIESAKNEFETARQQGVPPEVEATMNRYLSAIDSSSLTEDAGTDVKGYIDLFLGYDSNVNAATSDSTVAIPTPGGPIDLIVSPLGIESRSFVFGVGAGVDITHPLQDGWGIIAGARGYAREAISPFATGDFNGYGGVSLNRGRNLYTLAAQGDSFIVDHGTFRNAYGLVAQWNRVIDERRRTSVFFQATHLDYPTQKIRNANRYVGGLGYTHAFSNAYRPVMFVSAYGGVEDERDSNSPFIGYNLAGVRVGGQVNARADTVVWGSASGEFRRYHGILPLFQKTQHDNRAYIAAGVDYSPTGTFVMTPRVSYTLNDSNVPLFEYDRWELMLNIRNRFD